MNIVSKYGPDHVCTSKPVDQARDTCSVGPTSTDQTSVQVGLMDQAKDTCSV